MLELKRFNEEDKEMRATLNDVAKAANVSASLVSMHLNGHPLAKRIAEETKRRIDEAVRRLDYHPSAAARALSTGRSSLLGLVVGEISNAYFSHFAETALEEAAGSGYQLVIAVERNSGGNRPDVWASFLGQQLAGVIYCPLYREDSEFAVRLARRNTPLLLVNQRFGRCHSISDDSREAMYRAVTMLRDRGHRVIRGVFGTSHTKAEAFLDACGHAAVSGELCPFPTGNREERRAAVEELCRLRYPALVVNGHLTNGRLLRKLRTDCPDYHPDLVMSVAYWDRSLQDGHFLGAVLSRAGETARRAVRSLIELVREPDASPRMEEIPADFVPAAEFARIPVSDPEDDF